MLMIARSFAGAKHREYDVAGAARNHHRDDRHEEYESRHVDPVGQSEGDQIKNRSDAADKNVQRV